MTGLEWFVFSEAEFIAQIARAENVIPSMGVNPAMRAMDVSNCVLPLNLENQDTNDK